jgi:hypothetical protein
VVVGSRKPANQKFMIKGHTAATTSSSASTGGGSGGFKKDSYKRKFSVTPDDPRVAQKKSTFVGVCWLLCHDCYLLFVIAFECLLLLWLFDACASCMLLILLCCVGHVHREARPTEAKATL